MRHISKFSNEILMLIFQYLPPFDLWVNIPLVCKDWMKLSYDQFLYKSLTFTDESIPKVCVCISEISYLYRINHISIRFTDATVRQRRLWREFFASCKHLRKLKTLKLSGCIFAPTSQKFYRGFLSALRRLESLEMKDCFIPSGFFKGLRISDKVLARLVINGCQTNDINHLMYELEMLLLYFNIKDLKLVNVSVTYGFISFLDESEKYHDLIFYSSESLSNKTPFVEYDNFILKDKHKVSPESFSQVSLCNVKLIDSWNDSDYDEWSDY